MAPSTRQILSFPALDALRFIGAIAVVLTHTTFQTGVYGPTLLGTLVARLDIGVALFFSLSGFLLSRPYFSHLAQRIPMPRAGYYLWKRALRIVPVYAITVVAVLTFIPEARGAFLPRWIQNLTLTVIYGGDILPAGLTQMWSLATEVAFYLVLPLLMPLIGLLCCRSRWRPDRILVVLIALALTNVAWLSLVDLATHRPLWLPGFLSWFCVGMTIAVASVDVEHANPRPWATFIARIGAIPSSCFVAAFALLLIASSPIAGPIFGTIPTHGEAITKNLLYALFAFFLITPGVFADPSHTLMRFLSLPWLRYLGRISYGIFCIHLFVLYFTFKALGFAYFDGHFAVVFVATVASTLLLAAAIYRFVERPVNKLKRFGRPKTEPAINPNASAIAN